MHPTPRQLAAMLTKIDTLGPKDCWLWKGDRNRAGYGTITIFAKKKHSTRLGRVQTHRVLWIEAHGPIPDGMFVCHTCDNPPCCNPDHLFLGTAKANSDDKVQKSRQARGTMMPFSRLTEEAVKEILISYAAGTSTEVLAKRFNVCHETVSYVLRGKTWRHVEGPRPTTAERLARGKVENPEAARARSPITPDIVRQIRQRYRTGEYPSAIARSLNTTRARVANIIAGQAWTHVKDEE